MNYLAKIGRIHIPLGVWLIFWALCLPGIAQENAGNPAAVDASAHAEVDASVHASLDEPATAPPAAAPVRQPQPLSRWSVQPAKSLAVGEAFSSYRNSTGLPVNPSLPPLSIQIGTEESQSREAGDSESEVPRRAATADVPASTRNHTVTVGFAFPFGATARSAAEPSQPLRVLPGLPLQSDAGIALGSSFSSFSSPGDTAAFASPFAGIASPFTGNPSIFRRWYLAGAASSLSPKTATRRHDLHSDHDDEVFPDQSVRDAPGTVKAVLAK